MIKFDFYFDNINPIKDKHPICKVVVNNEELWEGKVIEHLSLQSQVKEHNVLQIHFVNKKGHDTIVDADNKVLQDLNFELKKIVIDGVDLKHLIWQSRYVTEQNIIESCLFFGPRGYYEIEFDLPILKWWLNLNHMKNNNDPSWETDYKYYEEACQRLDKIQTR